MKDELRALVARSGPLAGKNFAREYLQAQLLASLQRQGAMAPLAFLGGTALRFLYAIRRYSEDLDFSLERPHAAYDFAGYMGGTCADLRRLGYDVELARVRAGSEKAVHSAFVHFPGLLYELRLSGHAEQPLKIRVEVDTRPPAGALVETTVVRRHEMLHLQHHDRASLLAGKLHAVLMRPFPKGRDFYDLVWYLSDRSWPAPNVSMLNNALKQTSWTKGAVTETSWRRAVRDRVVDVNWDAIVADVRPLLENQADLVALSRENVLRLLADRARTKAAAKIDVPLPPAMKRTRTPVRRRR